MIGYILIIGVASFLFRGIFSPGFMSGYDNSIHYYEAYYLTQTLIPRCHWISGWTMQGMAGAPLLTYHPQTGFLLIAILNKIIRLPLLISYKVMVLFTHAFLGASFYKIASHRFGKSAALLMAVCLLLQKDVWRDGILFGIWNNFLGLGLFLIFFHLLDRHIDNLTIRRTAVLGSLLAVIIPTHLFAAAFAYCLLLIYAKDAIRVRVFAIGILACLAASYYIYPFIAARGYITKYDIKDVSTGLIWSLKSFFGPLENFKDNPLVFFINIPVIFRVIFSLFGAYLLLWKEKRRDMRRFLRNTIFFMIITLVIFSDLLPNLISGWRSMPLVGALRTNRFLIYAQIGMYIFAAYGLSRFLERLKRKKVITGLFSIVILSSVIFNYTIFGREGSRTLGEPQMANFFEVWNWVNKNVRERETRIIYENTVGNSLNPILRRSDVFALSGVFTKVPYIGVFLSDSGFPQEKYMRNDNGRIFGMEMDKVDASYIRGMMNYFNARYIVSVEPKLYKKLGSSRAFAQEEKFGELSIFRLIDFDSGWITFTKKARCEVLDLGGQSLKIRIDNESVDNMAEIKVAWHPFWQARLNGKPVAVTKGDYGMMRVALPKKGRYELGLSYSPIARMKE